jgi:hypothetical protein
MPPSVPKPLTGRFGMLVQVASLLVTGVLVWNSAVRPQLLFLPLMDVLARALAFALLAWILSACITAGLYYIVPGLRSTDVVASAIRSAMVGVWFAPACILHSHLSPASLAAALILVVAATRLLYSEWTATHPRPEPKPTPDLGLFGSFTVRRPIVTRELVTGLAAAVSLQSGTVAAMRHHPLLAGAWFVLSAAIVTLFAMVTGAVEDPRPPTMPRSAIGMAMTVLLAAGLTVGGIRAAHGRGSGDGSGDTDGPGAEGAKRGAYASARDVLKELFGDEEKAGAADNARKTPAIVPGILPDGSFPGVILWPEVKPVTRLVAPPPNGISTGAALERSYDLPFAGQYLFYRFPQLRPPPTSILQRGSPAALAYSTVDRRPLNMDAIQKLDEPIDLSCCRAIRIDIWNADPFPGTVTLQLYANETLLGFAPVKSTPDFSKDPVVAVPETLEFPTAPVVATEFKVVFRRTLARNFKSARIAIDRFVLVP